MLDGLRLGEGTKVRIAAPGQGGRVVATKKNVMSSAAETSRVRHYIIRSTKRASCLGCAQHDVQSIAQSSPCPGSKKPYFCGTAARPGNTFPLHQIPKNTYE